MNAYVETNFVLELALLQEQYQSCDDILNLCKAGTAQLVIPAYSLAEPYETAIRRHKKRRQLKNDLDGEIGQLARTSSYAQQISTAQHVLGFLIKSVDEEVERLELTRTRLLEVAEIIPLEGEILNSAGGYQEAHDLSPQDAIVYASVIRHLGQFGPVSSCFLNKNSKDFDDPDIVEALEQHNCIMLPRFDDGFKYLSRRTGN